ncbi:MAG: hypothetical protein AAGU23_11610 [Bacillota bacterium]|nr:hypothetical protein [Bacillota bacterium]HWR55445.1 hypothetical protein [Negativicutes bacterium]
MKNYVFVGLPLNEAHAEAAHRGIRVEAVRETAAVKNKGEQGLPYVIQERWIDEQSVILVSGQRLSGGQEGIY